MKNKEEDKYPYKYGLISCSEPYCGTSEEFDKQYEMWKNNLKEELDKENGVFKFNIVVDGE